MAGHAGPIARAALAVLCLAAGLDTSALAQVAAPPDFAPSSTVGWYIYGRQFMSPLSGPGPVSQHPDHPYVTNDEFRVTGRQPTFQLADLNTPILQPWAREALRKRNDLVLSGKPANQPHDRCWPVGVPAFLLRPMTQAMYVVQTPKEVVMILSSKQEVRRIRLDVPHSKDVKPSWYGESVGHYEGGTLVVDTIGIDERTWVDGFGTPHTKALHVVERFRLLNASEGGRVMEVEVYVEDPGAFTTPWRGVQRFRTFEAAVRRMRTAGLASLASAPEGPMQELICADNTSTFFEDPDAPPIPQATVPDF